MHGICPLKLLRWLKGLTLIATTAAVSFCLERPGLLVRIAGLWGAALPETSHNLQQCGTQVPFQYTLSRELRARRAPVSAMAAYALHRTNADIHSLLNPAEAANGPQMSPSRDIRACSLPTARLFHSPTKSLMRFVAPSGWNFYASTMTSRLSVHWMPGSASCTIAHGNATLSRSQSSSTSMP